MLNKTFFITGIGTGVGKTLISAILVEKLKAAYWKPVQSGDLGSSDTMYVKSLVSNKETVFYPESYQLSQPYSPHKSAAIDGITIDPEKFMLPAASGTLIIEGAGGVMVPLNDRFLMIDLIKKLNAPVILVSRNYLGSINHTLLSVNTLNQYQVPLRGIIFNGNRDSYTEDFILNYTGAEFLGRVPEYDKIDRDVIVNAGNYITDII